MKDLSLKFSLLIGFVHILFAAQSVFACQCYGLPTPYEAFKGANSVFAGKVISVTDESGKEIVKKKSSDSSEDYEREEGERYYRFAVQEWFKGTKKSEAVVSHSINMCEFAFDVGDEFLVYAYEDKGKLYTSTFCSRTKSLEEAKKDDIHFLRELLRGIPEPRIYGSVQLEYENPLTNFYDSKFLEGIKVIAQRNNKQYITFTDKNGLYRFTALPNGKYAIHMDLPNKYIEGDNWDRLFEINLQSDSEPYQYEYNKFSGTNAYSNLRLRWNNRISGKILDTEEQTLERASVKLIPVNQIEQITDELFLENKRYIPYLDRESQNSEIRKYKISGRTPGKYILAVEIYAPFASGKDRFRMYYPQTTDPKQAEVITIGEFSEQNIDIKLPAEFILRDIEGSFVWQDGTPVNGGRISLEKLNNTADTDNYLYDSEETKVVGKFKLKVFENAEYWLHSKVDTFKAKPIKVKVGKLNEPIKITVSTTDKNQ